MLLVYAGGGLAPAQPASVKIRFGRLDTLNHPAPNHATEWAQELFADLYDSSGRYMPPTLDAKYTWGVDFCVGRGMQFGWATGNGLYALRPDGNKLKSDPGCCAECQHQTYIVQVRVMVSDEFIQSEPVRIPNIQIPTQPGLSSNFPNPFSSTTRIKFQLNHLSRVDLRVYDMLGRMISELFNLDLPAGHHMATWQPNNVSPGVYFYRLNITGAGGDRSTYIEKMLVIR